MKKILLIMMLLFGVSSISAQTVVTRTKVVRTKHPVIKTFPSEQVVVTKRATRHRHLPRRRVVRRTTVIVPAPPPPVQTKIVIP